MSPRPASGHPDPFAAGPRRRPAGRQGTPGTAPFRGRHADAGRRAAADRLARADRSRTFPPLPPHTTGDTFATTWWGRAWLDALETTALDPARLARGRTYARDGHVDTINITPGRILATIRGSRPRPYSAEIRLRTLPDEEWDALLETVAAQPAQLAALLAKKLPEALTDGTVPLLPGPGDLTSRCSCPDHGRPCKHAAALCCHVARLLDADPFVLLLMRGRGERELLDDLTRRSAVHTARETHPEPGPHEARQGDTPREAAEPHGVRRPRPAGARPEPHGPVPPADLAPRRRTPESPVPAKPEDEAAPVPQLGTPRDPSPRPAHIRRGVAARDALADRPRPPLPPPRPLPDAPGSTPALPDGTGLPFDPAAVEFLATDTAARAHARLAVLGRDAVRRRPEPDPAAALTPWQDALRLAATTHPTAGLTSATRALFRDLAAATGRSTEDVARSVAAWRQGGREGLALLEDPWDPPAGDYDRARSALLAAGHPPLRPEHNHLTDPDRRHQLRFGHDGRWYPYESDPGAEIWWPTGPADPDPLTALRNLLTR
ncbi:SWIM zinc finger family protein [Streptomyces catenulae]|uniref:SWIM zinc finger family protein n=1 Tax=Streptomyces catenulae TaxID=66875 RepID=A0ABV2Z3I9_9ACTN|nr:SWIM zinc finger family protein [Streptomyces catenulae]